MLATITRFNMLVERINNLSKDRQYFSIVVKSNLLNNAQFSNMFYLIFTNL